jgi:hypothetical protein
MQQPRKGPNERFLIETSDDILRYKDDDLPDDSEVASGENAVDIQED